MPFNPSRSWCDVLRTFQIVTWLSAGVLSTTPLIKSFIDVVIHHEEKIDEMADKTFIPDRCW
jgi:hypothetical protein